MGFFLLTMVNTLPNERLMRLLENLSPMGDIPEAKAIPERQLREVAKAGNADLQRAA